MDNRALLSLVSIVAMIFVSTLTMPAAFAQNPTNSTEQCPYKYVLVDGVCEVHIKYNMGNMLWDLYQEHQRSSSAGASGASSSNGTTGGSAEQLVSIVVAFETKECVLPEDLGIVDKGPCFTGYGRGSMGVLIPIASLYNVTALDHVTGIYPESKAVTTPNPTESLEPSLDDDIGPVTADPAIIEKSSNPAAFEDLTYYIVPAVIVVTVAGIAITSYNKKRVKNKT